MTLDKCQNLTLERWFELLDLRIPKILTLTAFVTVIQERLSTLHFLSGNISFLFPKAIFNPLMSFVVVVVNNQVTST